MMDTPVGIHKLNRADAIIQQPDGPAKVDIKAGQNLRDELLTAIRSTASRVASSSRAFGLAARFVLLWLLCGPIFGFGHTWQLVIHTGMGIITFLMVFLIHHAQSRDSEALHLKLDILLLSNPQVNNELAILGVLSRDGLDKLKAELLSRINGMEGFDRSEEVQVQKEASN